MNEETIKSAILLNYWDNSEWMRAKEFLGGLCDNEAERLEVELNEEKAADGTIEKVKML